MSRESVLRLTLLLVLVLVVGCGGGSTTTVRRTAAVSRPPAYTAPAQKLPEPEPKPLPPPSKVTEEADKVFLAGFHKDAYEAYRRQVLASGDDLDAHDGLTRAAVKLNRLDETVQFYEKQLDSHSTSPAWCYGAARALLQAGDREQASTLALRAVKLGKETRLGRAYFLLGVNYYTKAVPEYELAWKSLQLAMKYDKNYGPTYYHLAKLEAAWRGNHAQAKALLSRGLPLMKPVESEVKYLSHVLMGTLLAGEKDYAAALEQFREARTIGGDRIYLEERINLGRLYELMGRPEDAVREWKDLQDRFGLASPTGLLAYRDTRRVRSKIALDYSNFLPGASEEHYSLLVSYLLKRQQTPPVRVPAAVVQHLNDIKTPVKMVETDLDGDGKVEVTVVEVRQKWDQDIRGYALSNPVLYVFTPEGGILGSHEGREDHFHDIALIDFNGDGKKEIVSVGFSGPNTLNLAVMTSDQRRYRNTFAQPIECTTGACGALVDDLDGDGSVEILTVSGGDLWVTVWQWREGGTFTDASARYSEFYRDYVKKYGTLKPEEIERFPVVKEHLEKARQLARGVAKEAEPAKAAADE